MDDDSRVIIGHYEHEVREADRLAAGTGRFELLRTQEILRRHLPPAPAGVLDVGGAAGVHAAWLAADGYRVHIVDLTPLHVEQAQAELGRRGVTAAVGDARQLSEADDSFDVVLLLGPLYHLVDRDDRVRALAEARRVARPGGLVAIAAVSRFASLLGGLADGILVDPAFRSIVEQDLRDGCHRNPGHHPKWFTTAYFHHPDGLREEIAAGRLELLELVGVEGPAELVDKRIERWEDEAQRESLLFAARAVESEPSLLGLSAHLLAVARAADSP